MLITPSESLPIVNFPVKVNTGRPAFSILRVCSEFLCLLSLTLCIQRLPRVVWALCHLTRTRVSHLFRRSTPTPVAIHRGMSDEPLRNDLYRSSMSPEFGSADSLAVSAASSASIVKLQTANIRVTYSLYLLSRRKKPANTWAIAMMATAVSSREWTYQLMIFFHRCGFRLTSCLGGEEPSSPLSTD